MKEFKKPISILLAVITISALLIYTAIPSESKLIIFCLLAFSLGLRHGLDADHIAAIDNVTRKMVAKKQNSYTVGIYFALGHSSVVFLMTLLIVLGALSFQGNATLNSIGATIGTAMPIGFLVITGLLNSRIFFNTYKNQSHDDTPSGVLFKLFHRLFDKVTHPKYMYIVGFLFGLGFDTATEIALLSMAATQTMSGMPIYLILLLPISFALGMVLTDALDSWMQLHLCKWSTLSTNNRRQYNLWITAFSVVVAFGIAGMEILSLVNEQASVAQFFDTHSELVGAMIITTFVISWGIFSPRTKNRLTSVKS